MSASSTDVSKKIRAAIKAKLEELGVYVDEELPDYIMVMIANKKPKQQMKDDLQLFLSKNASKFVDWLFEIFDRLQSASKSAPLPPPVESPEKEELSKKEGRKKSTSKTASKSSSKPSTEKISTSKTKKESSRSAKVKEKPTEKPPTASRKRRSSTDRDRSPVAAKRSTKPKRDTSPDINERSRPDESSSKTVSVNIRSQQTRHPNRDDRKALVTTSHRHDSDSNDDSPPKYHGSRNDDLVEVAVKRATQTMTAEIRRITASSKDSDRRDEPTAKFVDKPESRSIKTETSKEDERRLRHHKPITYDLDGDGDDGREMHRNKTTTAPMKREPVQEVGDVESPSPPRNRMSSQVQVKRRIPDRNSKDENARPSLFLKAMSEVKRSSKSKAAISASAGYGNKETSKKNGKDDHSDDVSDTDELAELRALALKAKSTSVKTASGERQVVRDAAEQEFGDTLVVDDTQTRSGTKPTGPKFVVTMGGRMGPISSRLGEKRLPAEGKQQSSSSGSVISPRKSVKQRLGGRVVMEEEEMEDDYEENDPVVKRRRTLENETNKENEGKTSGGVKVQDKRDHIAIHRRRVQRSTSRSSASLSPPPPAASTRTAKKRSPTPTPPSSPNEHPQQSNRPVTAPTNNATAGTGVSRHTPIWDGQINLDEEDLESSDGEDEEQIDAVLASASVLVSGAVDQELPPTTALSRPMIGLSPIMAPDGGPFYGSGGGGNEGGGHAGPRKERCKFWPGCRLSDEMCQFAHPSKPCKTFPNCSFGDRCLYIHPPCKFDRACTRPKCPFTHGATASRTNTNAAITMNSEMNFVQPTIPLTVAKQTVAPNLTGLIPCKFAGKCTNPSCLYKHPKFQPCRFGNACTNSACFFYHPPSSHGAVGFANRPSALPPPKAAALVTAKKTARYSWKATSTPSTTSTAT